MITAETRIHSIGSPRWSASRTLSSSSSPAHYAEPEFIAKKIERMSEKRLAEVLLQSWHPLAELEQLTESVVGDDKLLEPALADL